MKINNNHTEAQVISTYSRRMKIRTNDTKIGFAKILGKQLKPVCGDIVIIKKEENEPESIITDILPRKNSLSRKNKYKNKEVLASNLSDIAIVVSNPPSPDWHIVDRYIGAAENMGINAFIICNKDDLQWVEKENTSIINTYRNIGYNVIKCSAKIKKNMENISKYFEGKTSIFVGQSGVGKSTIINSLFGFNELKTQEISSSNSEGKHTTVNSSLIDLPNGGYVIDSPGVREFLPNLNNEREVLKSFIEIHDYGTKCKFNNCTHIKEDNCVVKTALSENKISQRRYDSYKRLMNKIRSSKDQRRY